MSAGAPPQASGQVLAPKRNDTSERDLLARIRSGDAEAFSALFDEYYTSLCGFVLSYVRDAAVAEDLVQDLFCALWNQRAEWDPPGGIRGYLLVAARNRAISHLRRREVAQRGARRWTDRSDAEDNVPGPRGSTTPDRDAELAELAEACRRAIHRLPERQRLVVTLRWQHHLSHAEIARAMGISVKGVEVQLTRALKTLRTRLQHFHD